MLLGLVSAIAGCDARDEFEAASVGVVAGYGTAVPLRAFLGHVQSASSSTLFEGLPHQAWEAEELKDELARKRTVQLNGFPFYEEAWVIEPGAASTLKAVLTQAGALEADPPGVVTTRLCGGFHPDYAIRWTAGEQVYDVLICFGCHEARCYWADGAVSCGISDAAVAELKTALAPYQRNRPRRTSS